MIPCGTTVATQVSEILRHVNNARLIEQERCALLLSELTPLVQKANEAARELDRLNASRFNVFKYLRDDEAGLSRVIADLLDPNAEHGQGTKFLEAMLDTLPQTRGLLEGQQPMIASTINVVTERSTADRRRIDIAVDIPLATGRFCLAFENKPYAADLDQQVSAYLKYLAAQYGTQFLLVYVPPTEREPDVASLPPLDRERWRENFTVIPYIGSGTSLKKWFATCRERCDAERVKSFLTDAESFCLRRFGEQPMTLDSELWPVREYLTGNPSHMRAAFAVSRAWPFLSEEVCQRFLKHLCQVVEVRLRKQLSHMEDDWRIGFHYGGQEPYSNSMWITRTGWKRFDDVPQNRHGRFSISLQSHAKRGGPNEWVWGVHTPKPTRKMSDQERERREKLDAVLERHNLSLRVVTEWWPQCEWLSRYQDWEQLVPELFAECEAGSGPISDYYVNGLLDIASCAIPAIDEVETAHPALPRG